MAQKRDSCGGLLPSVSRSQEALFGMEEIEKFSGFTESVLKKLVEERGFPMQLIGGKWVASRKRIDEWFYEVLGPMRAA
jgi:predicted DNA-binding transcriptional regulator AlpA